VEVVYRVIGAFNQRDMVTLREALRPDIELQTTVEAHHGHAGADGLDQPR